MRYLVVNHVPFGKTGRPGRYVLGDMWLADLRAQAQAVADTGGRLIVAAPLMERLTRQESGSFNIV